MTPTTMDMVTATLVTIQTPARTYGGTQQKTDLAAPTAMEMAGLT